jgi:microcystin-dependent protein
MSQPYIGEIRMFAGNFAPAGWMLCEGQLLAISEFEALFNLLGTTYGGDGQSTFALPDLRGRLPMHMGQGFTLAENGGVEVVTLTVQQIPSHSHVPLCSVAGNSGTPVRNYWATDPFGNTAAYNESDGSMMSVGNGHGVPGAIGSAGGSQPHNNLSPYLCVDFIISLFGIFPSQT